MPRFVFLLIFVLFSGTPFADQVQTVGPYLGSVSPTEAHLLYRPGVLEKRLRLTALDPRNKVAATREARSLPENDFVAKFHLTGLTPGTRYSYQIDDLDGSVSVPLVRPGTTHFFQTIPAQREGQIIHAAFISCVNDSTDGIWTQMAKSPLDLLCLSGDTPYVDTGDLRTIRAKHRHLLQRHDLAKLGRSTSVLGTWDDHDFGLNNGNGVTAAAAKQNTRKGFIEYRAHHQYGNGPRGIYHKTDRGALEVFLLDPRWFSMTTPSPVDPTQPTCYGNEQWRWLLQSLKKSKAPFKILLQGQIWQDKKNSETDDMFTYWAERDALLDFIKKEKISGVILIGGDIHVSRYLKHPDRVGYDLHDFIISPGHTSIIPSLNVYHPSLEWSRVEGNQYLTVSADTTKDDPLLTVTFTDQTGATNHREIIPLSSLTPTHPTGLQKDLRAYWSFDKNFDNQTPLGDRINAIPHGGAIQNETGIRGSALKLQRDQNQYLEVSRSILDDNADQYTVSAWIKPSALPNHGHSDRHFVLESFVNNHCQLPQASSSGCGISVGLRSGATPDVVDLQLYTETLKPASVSSRQPPGTAVQGGFDHQLKRSLLKQWTHLAVTFDTTQLRLFINGTLVKTHPLRISAPLAETGGLIIGGHRAGEGRNFDGLIDEIALWNRVLNTTEILSLSNFRKPANPLRD